VGRNDELNSSNHCSDNYQDGKVTKPEPEDLPLSINIFIKLSGERLEDLRL
jgi:hypothetical protein